VERASLIVVGGGPVGLAAAIEARLAGRSVLLLEPQAEVIDKACGEGLMPAAVAALARLGVAELPHQPFLGIRYRWGEAEALARFSAGAGWGVRRLALHAALAERARALGVERRAHRLRSLRQDADEVVVDEAFAAPYLLAADGLHSPVRALLGLGLPRLRPRRVGLRRHFRVAAVPETVDVYWSAEAEAYVTPVGPAEVGVAFLFREAPDGEGPPFDRLLAGFPALAAQLGDPTSALRGAGPFEQRVARRVAGRALLIGDAAGYLDPLTGEGLRLGLETARAAVAAIEAGAPGRYEADWWRITRAYRWMTGGLLTLTGPAWVRRRLVPTLARVPALMGRIVEHLARG
jgi:flavin-dependent dehydrogenase